MTFRGERGANAIDASGDEHGAKGRLTRLTQFFWGEESDDVREYEEKAREGASVLAANTPEKHQREQVRSTLDQRRGYWIKYFGSNVVERLVPPQDLPSAGYSPS